MKGGETKRIKISKRLSVTIDFYWQYKSCALYKVFYLFPQMQIRNLNYENAHGSMPKYVIQFNWLYVLVDINIFNY